ncbi:MAG: hypothetical protein RLZZ28_1665 [Bacteroidota bacterium]
MVSLLVFLFVLAIAIQTEWVQNKLVSYATKKLSEQLGTEVSIKKVSFSLFNSINLEKTLVRDRHGDSLLYAGQLKVRLTDWFFIKDKIVLKYIGLEEAKINLHRKDSVWNFKYLVDFFASPNPKKTASKPIDLNLKVLDLKNVSFVKEDLWVGERMTIRLGSLLLDAENMDFAKNSYAVNSIKLDNSFFGIQQLKALKPPVNHLKKAVADSGMYFNEAGISVAVADISIRNSQLFFDDDLDKPLPIFDGAHIQLSKLNGTLKNVSFINDTIKSLIDIRVKDRCGLELRKLKTAFKLTPQIMELSNLDLQTGRSKLSDYYAMHFKDFNKDFGDYISKVFMKAQFRNAKINSDDIAYFTNDVKNWRKEVVLSGNFNGTVADFNIPNLVARVGMTTAIYGNLKMTGLPNIDRTKIGFSNGVLQTNYYDLGVLIPSLKGVSSPNLAALGDIIYRGNFNGTPINFVTAGNFSTKLGAFKTDISLQLPNGKEPVYSGAIETSRFNIGKFLNDTSLGLADFNGKISGSGFTMAKLKTSIEGNLSSLEYNHYTYSNIFTNGTFQKKYFTGEIKVNDPNLDFTSSLEIDLSKELPKYNIVGDLVHADFKNLNLYKNPIKLTGLLDVNFTGTNIDNFAGSAKLINASISNEINKLSFDSLSLSSHLVDSIKILELASPDFSASIKGKFSIIDLPASFQSLLTRYFPTYINQPKSIPQNQSFSFAISTAYIEPYIRLFGAGLSGFNDTKATGSLDTRLNKIALDLSIPFGRYSDFGFSGIDLKGRGDKDTLSLNGNINSFQVGKSLSLPNTSLHIVSKNDFSKINIITSESNNIHLTDLSADVYTLPDGARIQFQPSTFLLNEKKWTIEKSGELIFGKNTVQAKDLHLTQGFEEIHIASIPAATDDKKNNLGISIKNLILGDLTSLLFKEPRLQGITNGNILLTDITGKFNASADLKTEQFRIDNDSLGKVDIKASYDNATGNIPFIVESPNDEYRFTAKGNYNLKDSSGKSFTTTLQLEHTKIDILHKFLSDLFSDIKGQAHGDLTISGDPNAPDLHGKISLRDAGMKVNYSQVYYRIDSAEISFLDDGIDFGKFTIHDKFDNKGEVKGKLTEKGFKNLAFDFELSTDKMLLIDTKSVDNQQFYGKAIGRASLKLKGPETDAKMTIVAESTDSSHIYIPNSISRESGNADFIVFRQYGTEMEKKGEKSSFNLTVDLDITASKLVQIDVILDELSGDVIKARGDGKLKIRAGSIEPLSIRGRYTIDRGDYVFNFQGLIRKPFELLPEDGNYIEWTGDPFKADIHINAQYTAERISLSELVSNLNLSPAVNGYRGDVYVIAQLREKLNQPGITFKLDFPQGSPVKSDNEFVQYLNRLEKDQLEILNQVAFLILFNSFAPKNGFGAASAGISPYSIKSLGYNTISQVLTKSVNKAISNLLYKITGDKSLRFDLGASIYSSSSIINSAGDINAGNLSNNQLDRTRVDLKLGYAFAQDKIIVTVGSDIDFNIGSSNIQNGNVQWLPNVNIEFILTQDKKLRLIVFNKNSLDLSGNSFSRRNRQGVSISYRKDFETMFAKKEKDIEIKNPPDSSGNK